MKRFALERVRELAAHRLEIETRALKLAQGRWLDARAIAARAERKVADARSQLAADLAGGLDGAALAEHGRAAATQRASLEAALQVVANTHTHWKMQMSVWQAADSRERALDVLHARWLARRVVAERRTEQRSLDEWATRNRLVAGGRAR
jgi:flagellar export protein FliJ